MTRNPEANSGTFMQRLEEADRFFTGTGKVYDTVRMLAADLDREHIDYALIGAMALNAHGYRRETVDVDVLVRPEGLEKFRIELVGRGYRPAFEGAKKAFRNAQTGVQVEFIASGEYPGDGKPKPVVFPDPVSVATDIEGIKVVDLPTLVNLKLASGMTASHRIRDLADVQALIETNGPESIPFERLNPFVRNTYMQLCHETVKSFRIATGTDLDAIPNFAYFLRLMAGIESLRAAMRWYIRIESDVSTVWSRDDVTAAIYGAGTCAELVRCLRDGEQKGFVERHMLEGDPQSEALWDRLFSERSDDLVGKIHRMRDKYFGHWDKDVLDAFIQSQRAQVESEPFIESDADGKFLHTRYLWPIAAFAFDLVGKPGVQGYEEEQKKIFRGLFRELWPQIVRLTAKILTIWVGEMVSMGRLKFEPVEDNESNA